jgi:hypothetical protein
MVLEPGYWSLFPAKPRGWGTVRLATSDGHMLRLTFMPAALSPPLSQSGQAEVLRCPTAADHLC